MIVSLNITDYNSNTSKIDLSNIDFEIKHNISITSYRKSVKYNIIPYKSHVYLVSFRDENNIFDYNDIKGWDCDYLIIPGSTVLDDSNKIDVNKVQTIINNNPKTEQIYYHDLSSNRYFKIHTNTSKRIFDKVIRQSRSFDFSYDKYVESQTLVMKWEVSHKDLIPK